MVPRSCNPATLVSLLLNSIPKLNCRTPGFLLSSEWGGILYELPPNIIRQSGKGHDLMYRQPDTAIPSAQEIVGRSTAFQHVMYHVALVAKTDSTVLIQGETGTGKEVIARTIHEQSTRSGAPFIKMNCAAIPGPLLESELFGHERGAFTGACGQTKGRFELAHRGTLFLDEIGDLPLELQPKLLRVLQEQEFERLGGSQTIRVNVRVVAATNQDLAQRVADKQFRADLYYRLYVFPICLPALRERVRDIPLLAQYFVSKYSARFGKQIDTIPDEVMAILQAHDWPGNIRELQNVIERAVIFSPDRILRPILEELPQVTEQPTRSARLTLAEAEREHVLEALNQTNWKIGGQAGAAVRLGVPRTTLIYKLRRLGIDPRHPHRALHVTSAGFGTAVDRSYIESGPDESTNIEDRGGPTSPGSMATVAC
jgi:formate hydrogenlyase transcriptional activator